ncbi:MAG: RNA polymerase sigma factor [Elusimicrobiota bacterium]
MDKIRSGEIQLYGELVRRHYSKIKGLCLSLLSDSALSEDACQDVFLKAYRFLGGFERESSFPTWIYRIASNHCLDLMRRAAREKTESLDFILESEYGEPSPKFMPAEPDVSKAVELRDLADRILARLPPDYRAILALKEVQGLNYKELAQTLDCSIDAVKGRLKRARAELERIARHFSASSRV